MMEIEKQSKVLKWALVIGIVIVINMFFNYSLSLVYKHPLYEAYCPVQQVNEAVVTERECVDKGGQWNAHNQNIPTPKGETMNAGYCNLQFTCQNNYNAAQKVYDRNVFITLVILGALCVALSNFFIANMLMSIALSLSGVLSFIVASMRYWSSADDLVKVIILAIALGILVFVATKKFKNN